MIQPALSPRSPDVRVVGQQLNVVDVTKQPKPIKAVIVPVSEPSASPRPSGVTELPYRTRIDYKAEDDDVPTSTVSQARTVDYVTTQSRSVGTSGTRQATAGSSQLISVTSPSPQEATRIQIGDSRDQDQCR